MREAFLNAQGKLAESGARQHAENYELLIRKGVDVGKPLLPPFVDNVTVANLGIVEGNTRFGNAFIDSLEPSSANASQLNQRNKVEVNAERLSGELHEFGNVFQTDRKKA